MRPSPPLRTVSIGAVVYNARAFNLWKRQEVSLDQSTVNEIVDRLFRLLEERRIDFLLVGGIAILRYVAGRNTEDVDLILASSSLARLPEISITRQDGDFARGRFDDLQVDLLLTSNALFERVRRERTTRHHFENREIPCATVEGLLLLKLYALPSLYRQGDFTRVNLYEADIAALLREYKPEIEPLLAELGADLSATDLKSLRQIVGDIQARIERFERGVERS
jgi:hypothetical protein